MTGALRRLVALTGAALLILVAVVPATASPAATVRDEFKAVAFDGDDGTTSWASDWRELPFGDGPDSGQIQVVGEGHCVSSKCLRLGKGVLAAGIFREADLSGFGSATLSFSYRRRITTEDDQGEGKIRVRVGKDIWSWVTLATYEMGADDSGHVTETLDISDWAGDVVNVAFFGEGQMDGFIYIDDVQISMSAHASSFFVASLPNRSDSEGEAITFAAAADDDGDLTFSAIGLPQGISIDSDTGLISGRVGYEAAASSPYVTVVTASDGHGAQYTEPFTWFVANSNRAPVLEPIVYVVIDEGSALQVQALAADSDLPHDSLSYTLTGAPSGASVSSGGLISWTSGETAGPGSFLFTVKVSDSGTPPLVAIRAFVVTVKEVNTAPTVGFIPDQANGVGDTVSLTVAGSDPDIPSNRMTYSATGLPSGVSIGSTSGVISGTIPRSAPQSNTTVTVIVQDNGSPRLSATRTFSWQVTRGNHAPVLGSIPEQNPQGGQMVTFAATATDADDGDTLTYWLADGIDPIPTEATINSSTGRFTWTPTEDQHGATYRINVGVSDSGSPRLSDTQLVTITVPKINQPPLVEGPGTQRSAEGDGVTVTVRATDPEVPPDRLHFSATGLPGGLLINSTTGVIAGVIDYESATESPYDVAVTVTDDGSPSKSAVARFQWHVDNTNQPPLAEPISLVALVGEPARIVVPVEDPDGDELEYSVVSPPSAGTLEGEGPEFVYTSPGGADEDLFSFMVTDGEFEVEAAVSIEIRSGNSAPNADPDSYDLAADDVLRVDAPGVLANDSDLDGDMLIAELVAGPDNGRLVLNGDGSFSYIPANGFAGGDKFIYAITDSLGERATATVVLNVLAPVVPAALPIDDDPRLEILAATAPAWQPPDQTDETLVSEIQRSVVAAISGGISPLPELRFPLLLLAVALLLGLTIGRLSLLPFGVAKRPEEGWVQSYDEVHEVGRVFTDDDREIFVHRRALEKVESLVSGQRVRLVASEMRGRRIALKVWPV